MDDKGFTLVETILAIAILGFGIVSVYGAFATTVTLTGNISNRFIAAYLTQEGVEIIKNLRDNNFVSGAIWDSGINGSPCSTGCMASYKTQTPAGLTAYNGASLNLDSDGFYGYDAGTTTIFKRNITITPIAGTTNILKVNVSVIWSYKGIVSDFQVDDYLYNWN